MNTRANAVDTGSFRTWFSDTVAGSVVFLVALPLCLGIALASDAPLISGLLAGIVGGIVVGALSGSHTSVSGPAAGLTAVVAAQIAILGSFQGFLVALFIAGLIQIAFGALRCGFIAAFFPSSVIKGLLSAIGIILVLKQLPHLVGWDANVIGEMSFWQSDNENTFSELVRMFSHLNEGALVIGLGSLLMLLLWDRSKWLKATQIPAPLVVVALGVASYFILQRFGGVWSIEAKHLVQVPLTDSVLALFTQPDFSRIGDIAIYTSALTIALVASLETLLNLDAVDRIDRQQRVSPPNRELLAQGVGNTLLGLLGGLPVTSVVIRGTVNINAGAKTKRSAVIHGLFLLVAVVAFPQVMNLIPLSCLAAILIATGLKLINKKIVVQMWNAGMNQFVPFAVTVLAIVFEDLLIGVGVGLATSALFILHSNLRRPLQWVEEQHFNHKVFRLVLANQVSFLNRASLARTFEQLQSGDHIVLDGSHTIYMDADIVDLIRDFRENSAPARGVNVSLVGFKESLALENKVSYAEHSTNEFQRNLLPSQVLQILKNGNDRVRRGQRLDRDLSRQISATSDGQFPIGAFLSCMDSRASVELIFDLGIGDIFSTRIAGHVVSEKVLGSLEYACAVAGAKLIVVMGHTRCGAVSAAIDAFKAQTPIEQTTGCEHLGTLVHDIQKVVSRNDTVSFGEKGTTQRERVEEWIVRENVSECMTTIMKESTMLRTMINDGKIAIVGCIYDVRDGNVEFIREINHEKGRVTEADGQKVPEHGASSLVPEYG